MRLFRNAVVLACILTPTTAIQLNVVSKQTFSTRHRAIVASGVPPSLARFGGWLKSYSRDVDIVTSQVCARLRIPTAPVVDAPPQEMEPELEIADLAYMPISSVRAHYEGRVVPVASQLPPKVWAEQAYERIVAARQENQRGGAFVPTSARTDARS